MVSIYIYILYAYKGREVAPVFDLNMHAPEKRRAGPQRYKRLVGSLKGPPVVSASDELA